MGESIRSTAPWMGELAPNCCFATRAFSRLSSLSKRSLLIKMSLNFWAKAYLFVPAFTAKLSKAFSALAVFKPSALNLLISAAKPCNFSWDLSLPVSSLFTSREYSTIRPSSVAAACTPCTLPLPLKKVNAFCMSAIRPWNCVWSPASVRESAFNRRPYKSTAAFSRSCFTNWLSVFWFINRCPLTTPSTAFISPCRATFNFDIAPETNDSSKVPPMSSLVNSFNCFDRAVIRSCRALTFCSPCTIRFILAS